MSLERSADRCRCASPVRGDGATASLAELLDRELRPNKRTVTVRVQVRASSRVEPGNVPHVYFETSSDGVAWEELADVGAVRPGFVREANQTFPTCVAVRARWEHAADEDATGSWWLKIWLGDPPTCFA